jgi:hypothetical protein
MVLQNLEGTDTTLARKKVTFLELKNCLLRGFPDVSSVHLAIQDQLIELGT